MLSINKISNGAGATFGWAVLEDGIKVLAKFSTVEEALAFEAAYVKNKIPYLYRPIAMYGGKVLKCCIWNLWQRIRDRYWVACRGNRNHHKKVSRRGFLVC